MPLHQTHSCVVVVSLTHLTSARKKVSVVVLSWLRVKLWSAGVAPVSDQPDLCLLAVQKCLVDHMEKGVEQ